MKHLFPILITAILCATASAQTIKTLGFNSTNGQVVANTGTNVLTFTNSIAINGTAQINVIEPYGGGSGISILDSVIIDTNGVGNEAFSWGSGVLAMGIPINFATTNIATTTRANLGFSTNLNTLWTATNASNARSAVGLGATWLTNTNVTNFRTAVGLGAGDDVAFNEATVFSLIVQDVTPIGIAGDGLSFNDTNSTNIASGKAGWRDSLGLPLSALTNTSNATAMRALGGSTNTNEPYSGTVALTNTNVLTFSNGVLLRIQ